MSIIFGAALVLTGYSRLSGSFVALLVNRDTAVLSARQQTTLFDSFRILLISVCPTISLYL